MFPSVNRDTPVLSRHGSPQRPAGERLAPGRGEIAYCRGGPGLGPPASVRFLPTSRPSRQVLPWLLIAASRHDDVRGPGDPAYILTLRSFRRTRKSTSLTINVALGIDLRHLLVARGGRYRIEVVSPGGHDPDGRVIPCDVVSSKNLLRSTPSRRPAAHSVDHFFNGPRPLGAAQDLARQLGEIRDAVRFRELRRTDCGEGREPAFRRVRIGAQALPKLRRLILASNRRLGPHSSSKAVRPPP